MTRTSTNNNSFASRFGLSGESIVAGARQAFDELRRPADPRAASRPERGDVRAAVLETLAVHPMSGYQIVRALEDRGHAAPSPNAGAVYPTLQMLADEGLATATDEDGKKVYTLTDAGRIAAAAAATRTATPETLGTRAPVRRGALPRAAAQLAQATALIGQSGDQAKVADAIAVLDEARRKVHAILARN